MMSAPRTSQVDLDSLVEAAQSGPESALDQAIAQLTRQSPIRVAPALSAPLGAASPMIVEAAARAALAVFQTATVRSWWALDRAMRERDVASIAPERVAVLARLPRARLGALALASMQRDGWTRARAVAQIAHADHALDTLGVCLLLTRLNDPVPEVAREAEAVLVARIGPSLAVPMAAALGLIDASEVTVRAAHSGIAARFDAYFRNSGRRGRDALVEAAAATDEDSRVAALMRLERYFSDEEGVVQVLARGLDDRSPRVRRAVAEFLVQAPVSPIVAAALLPRLELNRSPAIRLLGLRWRRRQGDTDALLAACFDENANLRHYARRYHRGAGGQADYRELALERLQNPCLAGLVGALATLSDLGRQADAARVEPFTRHASRRVAREAQRTLGLLS